jgi:hypothetical protein
VRTRAYDGRVTLREHQPEAMAALDAAYARAAQVVDPALIRVAQAHVDHLVADGPIPPPASDEREADVAAVIDQMLIDVARVDEHIVSRADRHFGPGGLADLVMASYILEARTRLRVAGSRLLGAGT